MNILITGGAGYIGSACARYFLAQDHMVTVYDNLSTGNLSAAVGAWFVNGDVRNTAKLLETLTEREIDAVIHTAAVASVPESIAEPLRYWEINLHGTGCVLDAMRQAGTPNLIFSSSAAVYSQRDYPIDEDYHTFPQTPYGGSKLAAERLIKDCRRAHGVQYTIFRYFNVCGALLGGSERRKHETHLIPLAVTAGLNGTKLNVFGDGTAIRDYVHIGDLVRAHGLALERPQNTELNLGSGVGTSVLDIIRLCSEATGSKCEWTPQPVRAGDPSKLTASILKSKRSLGWVPELDVQAAVQSAVAWRRSSQPAN